MYVEVPRDQQHWEAVTIPLPPRITKAGNNRTGAEERWSLTIGEFPDWSCSHGGYQSLTANAKKHGKEQRTNTLTFPHQCFSLPQRSNLKPDSEVEVTESKG